MRTLATALAAGEQIADFLLAGGSWSIDGAMAATRALMASATPPDALFCANDMMAIGALNVVAGELGREPGKDISVVGFDDIAMAAWPLFNLTTWVQPLPEMIAQAMTILRLQLANAAAPPQQQRVSSQLVIRGSARLPR